METLEESESSANTLTSTSESASQSSSECDTLLKVCGVMIKDPDKEYQSISKRARRWWAGEDSSQRPYTSWEGKFQSSVKKVPLTFHLQLLWNCRCHRGRASNQLEGKSETSGSKAATPWKNSTRSLASWGEETNTGWFHLPSRRFGMGILGGGVT